MGVNHMKKLISALLAAALLFTLAACGEAEAVPTENSDTYVFTDDLGREVVAPAHPERVAAMIGSFAEFERAMIRERTSAGLAQARAEGRVGGRRPKLNPKQRSEIADSVISGRKSAAEMARIFGVSQPTVSRIVAERRAYPGKTL